MGEVAVLRAALTGQAQSPGLFEVMAALGRRETLSPLADAASQGVFKLKSRSP